MSMQHVSLRQLRVFEAAAANLSFSKAAEILHLTQPGVSMHIKELEGHAGLPLFERVGRKLFVTQAGLELLSHTREVLRSLKDAEEAFDGLRGLRRGRINLAVVSTAKYFAPRLLARFRDQHPALEIRLAVNNRDSVIEQLTNNQVDLAIMGRPPKGLATRAEAFAAHPLVFVCPFGHPLCGAGPVPVTALEGERFVVRESGSGTRAAMEMFFAERRLAPHITMEMSSNETIKQAVMAGMGISFLSLHTVWLEVASNLMSLIEVIDSPVMRTWNVVSLQSKLLSPAADAFRRFILEHGEPHLLAGDTPILTKFFPAAERSVTR